MAPAPYTKNVQFPALKNLKTVGTGININLIFLDVTGIFYEHL